MEHKTDKELPQIITAKDTAKYLGISNNKLYALLKCRDFPSVKIGCRYYVLKDKLAEWLERKSHDRKDTIELFFTGRGH